MKKVVLKEKTTAVVVDIHKALQTMYDTLKPGKRKKIVKNEAVKALYDRHGVNYADQEDKTSFI